MKLRVYLTTLLVFSLNLIPINKARAMVLASPGVDQVAHWFSGLFDNTNQVINNPNIPIPYLTMANCPVALVGMGDISADKPIYLEQRIGGFDAPNPLLRSRFYGFNQDNSTVDLNIHRFQEENSVLGLCNLPESQREINMSTIIEDSCDLSLIWQSNSNSYTGKNDPLGCPSSTGGKVVSEVEIFPDLVLSLDQIFSASGDLLLAQPIEFERIEAESVPESSVTLSLLLIGIIGAFSRKK